MLANMSQAYMGPDYGSRAASLAGQVTAGAVDGLAQEVFPLCMTTLHSGLKRDHHLRHGGRMQYGLFLKGIGLGLDEALKFWQAEFTKKMTGEEFVKQYAYNIRHNYGKEGKRADYTPYSCQRIILGAAPGNGEFHGCPYKHWSDDNVKAAMSRWGLGTTQITAVLEAKRAHAPQLACRAAFEARYNVQAGNAGNHPNAYYEEARAALEAREHEESAASQELSQATTAGGSAAATPAA